MKITAFGYLRRLESEKKSLYNFCSLWALYHLIHGWLWKSNLLLRCLAQMNLRFHSSWCSRVDTGSETSDYNKLYIIVSENGTFPAPWKCYRPFHDDEIQTFITNLSVRIITSEKETSWFPILGLCKEESTWTRKGFQSFWGLQDTRNNVFNRSLYFPCRLLKKRDPQLKYGFANKRR